MKSNIKTIMGKRLVVSSIDEDLNSNEIDVHINENNKVELRTRNALTGKIELLTEEGEAQGSEIIRQNTFTYSQLSNGGTSVIPYNGIRTLWNGAELFMLSFALPKVVSVKAIVDSTGEELKTTLVPNTYQDSAGAGPAIVFGFKKNYISTTDTVTITEYK